MRRREQNYFMAGISGTILLLLIGGGYSAWECRQLRREVDRWKLKAAYWQFAYDHQTNDNFIVTDEWRVK